MCEKVSGSVLVMEVVVSCEQLENDGHVVRASGGTGS